MDVSVIIPTFGRAEKLGRCLARLARQDFERGRFEVLVGVDGKSEQETGEAVHEIAARTAGAVRYEVFQFEHAGPGVTRNRLVERAGGKLLLMLNDDVLPEAELISRHVEAHRELGRAAMVLGSAPWVVPADDTVFDRLVRETSMVFFYDRMEAAIAKREAGADYDWGFRHAWTLNLSMPREAFKRVGGFDARLKHPMYEDLEFAYRAGVPVAYRPGAAVEHDHRLSVEEYLGRERKLGQAAWELAAAAPGCAREIFRRDIRSREEVEACREFVEKERGNARRLREMIEEWGRTPAAAGGDDLHAMYEEHLPLKRWTWRSGLLNTATTG